MTRPATLLAVLLAAVPAAAQPVAPHIGYVYRAGGRRGETFEITVGGQFLDRVDQAYLSGEGARAEVVAHTKPMSPGEFNKLREQLDGLMQKRKAGAWTPADENTVAEIRAKIATFIRRPSSPAIAETVTVRVTLAPDAAPGLRELRLATPLGLTNPMAFTVGELPEYSKKPAKVTDDAAPLRPRFLRPAPEDPPAAPIQVELPAVLNGQIVPGGVDRYRFRATKGQKLVAAAAARELIPYISDAVPGWFQATLALYDASGKELAYADDYRFHPDPVLTCEIPADGEYELEIKDAIYRGREDFVYRIRVGELPYITSVFPLGAKAGARTRIELSGWNLPAARIEHRGGPVSVRRGGQFSNALPFAADNLPEQTEREPNNLPRKARKLKLPAIVNGRIAEPGDTDVFRIDARAGEEMVAEVLARRLESPLDSILRLTDRNGRELALEDDHEDRGAGLLTHHADALLRFRFPAKGTYYLHLADAQHKGGPEYGYRLRVSRPRPDFELRVAPASIAARAGAAVPVTVHAMRRDGFAGEIALALRDAPPGFHLSGARIPAGQDKVLLTLTLPLDRIDAPALLRLEGRATVDGREVRRAALPAEDMMQAFAYQHLVPAAEWMVRMLPGGRGIAMKLASDDPVKLHAGGAAAPVRIATRVRLSAAQLALREPPEGIAIERVSPARDGLDILLRAGGKLKPGLKGNLIVDAYPPLPAAKKQAPARRRPMATLPAIPFEIVAP